MDESKKTPDNVVKVLQSISARKEFEEIGIVLNKHRLRGATNPDFIFNDKDKKLTKEMLEKHRDKVDEVVKGEFLNPGETEK